MTTAWFYNYYEKSAFPHQRELCQAVEWVDGCNLEGRQKVSPDCLSGIPTNPLTLRLRAVQKVLWRVDRQIRQTNKYLNSKNISGMKGTLHLENSQLRTGGAAVVEICIDNNAPFLIYYDKLHFALYEFFTNLGSILDRLAYEINILYQLGDWVTNKLNWAVVTDSNNRYFKCLKAKDKPLADFIQAQKSCFIKIPSYRNRLVHDAVIHTPINPPDLVSKFQLFLPEDPNDNNSPMNVDAISFCKKAKKDVLKLLDGSYELMLQHYHNHGNPPW